MLAKKMAAARVVWCVAGLLAALAQLAPDVLASTAPPHEYHLLSPEPLTGPLSVMSLEPNNTITFGSSQLTLQQYETATIPASAFTSGTKFSGTGFFTLGSQENAADLLTPDDFAGTSFVVPHIAGSHRYYVLSPSGSAQVTVQIGASTFDLTAYEGVLNEVDAGSDNGVAGRITSDVPILLAHAAYVSGVARDAYPVPPTVNEVFGVRSQNTIVGALSDGTSLTVYASNGVSESITLDAGEQTVVTAGASSGQGQGSAVHIVANAPIAAVQYDDGDGNDATAFWTSSSFGRRHGVPVNAQYLAIVCDQPGVTVALYRGTSAPQVQSCSGSSTTPGKAYFGASTSGSSITAGWYVISSAPVYVMYEASASEDEQNTLGWLPPSGPTEPVLNAVSSPTTNNPQSVSGTAGANQTVRLYVNGRMQATTTANASGTYTFNTALLDGPNTLYTTAVVSGNESNPSNAVSVDYTNTIPRSQSGTIAGSVVWTPGNPAAPYTITAADLVIAAGAQLTLQPGTELRFGSGRRLTVNGTLKVNGVSGAGVTFTSNLATPTRGSWVGLVVSSTATAVAIEGATIEWAQSALNITGAAVSVRNNVIRNFSVDGILISGAGASGSVIRGNLIDNLNDTVDCLEIFDASPQVIGNTLTNCNYGLHVNRNSSPAVNGNNIITGNNYGIQIFGNSATPQPVITGNQIAANDTNSVRVQQFAAGAVNVKLNLTGNWWGSADATTIGNTISDLTDSYTATDRASVNYASFLDGPLGTPVPGNYLIGPFTDTAAVLSAATYDVLGVVFVSAGKSLTIPAGATLRFHGAATRLVVDGALSAQGINGNRAVLTSGRTMPARGDWPGVLSRAGSSTSIEYGQIEYAASAVSLTSVPGTVRNTIIRYFSADGILATGAGSSASVLELNTIDNLNDSADCVELLDSSPSVSGNTLTNCSFGLHVNRNSAPAVGNNLITGNGYGIQIFGNSATPQPVITGNRIFANTTYNVRAYQFAAGAQNVRINATGNWWGTVDPTTISEAIYDLTDSYTATDRPTVDFSGFLDAPNGTPVPGQYLIGPFSAAATTLLPGTTYEVIGTVFVPAAKSLTIPAGATLRFHAAALLVVDGVLTVQGAAGNLVTLTSGQTAPARGDWPGILVRANGSVIEYARVEYATTGVNLAGVAATVRNSTIRLFVNNGVYLTGAAASSSLIQGNTIDNVNDTGDCIEANASSATISGNTLTNCQKGVNVTGGSNATTINGGNVITANDYGIYVDGTGGFLPAPVVTGNQLFANDTYNYYTNNFGAGAANQLRNATGNWWGSVDPTTIAAGILDLNDAYTATDVPTVDYSSFLNGPNGTAVPGNYLLGPLTATATTLTSGTTYDVLSVLFVPNGKTLSVQPGAVLRFHASSFIVVDGSISIQGASGNPAILTSGRPSVARGDWQGVFVRAGTGSLVEYAQIDYATTGVNVGGVVATVRNNLIRSFLNNGVYVSGAGAAGTLVQGNSIDNSNDTGDCIEVSGSSPTLTGNTLTNCQKGVNITGAANATTVNGNTITGNDYGMYVDGTGGFLPAPVVTGNQLFGNDTYNYYTNNFGAGAANQLRNATGNWWGSVDPTTIAASILDLNDNIAATDVPLVDYSGFLDGPNGSPVPGNYLIGPLAPAATTLASGSTYDILGHVWVPNGKSLTIEAGVLVRFWAPGTRLIVDGSLVVQGTTGAKARLTSGRLDPEKGDWYGIEVRATASGVTIDHSLIEWTQRAVSVTGTNATISNSLIRNFTESAIRLTNVTAATQVTGNYIDNYDRTGYGIYLSAASPVISSNQIYRTSIGIFAIGASNAQITGNAISNNARGIVLDGNGSNSASAVPNPVITGNDIFGNTGAQIEIYRYGATNPVVINATNNWWGTATPANGTQIRFTSGSPAATLDYSTPSTGPITGPVGGNVVLSEYHISPNGDGVKEATTVTGTLNQSAAWTVTIRNLGYAPVRSFTGSGTAISAVWDGRDAGGALLPDATYTVEVTAAGTSGNTIVGTRLATIDTAAPTTIISSPPSGGVLDNGTSITVLGTAADPYLVNYTLQYGAGTAPSTWTNLASQASGVIQGMLGTWVVGSTTGGAATANGSYVLRLTTSDKAGNVGLVLVPLTLDLLAITNITQSVQVMKPALGEQLQVNFTLSMPATVTLRIEPEAGGAAVREIAETFTSGGAKSMTWNGRNTSGAYVPDEAYSYALLAASGSRTATYDQPPAGTVGSGSGTVDSTFNANKNDFWKMNYTMGHFGRIRMQVSGCTATTHFPYNWVPYPPGTHPLMWNGRGPDGQLVSGACNIYFDAPLRMKSNSVIVRGTAPTIVGTGASPAVEVRSNPYRITHSYEHISRITYRIDQDSYVTVKLLPPGVADPASPQAIVLIDNVLQSALSGAQPVDHLVEWKGYDDLDTNDILVGTEGSYTFAIQATSVSTGATTLYRGVLQLWQ